MFKYYNLEEKILKQSVPVELVGPRGEDSIIPNPSTKKEIIAEMQNYFNNRQFMLEILDDRDAAIFAEYYGINGHEQMSVAEIAKQYDLATSRIREILTDDIRRLGNPRYVQYHQYLTDEDVGYAKIEKPWEKEIKWVDSYNGKFRSYIYNDDNDDYEYEDDDDYVLDDSSNNKKAQNAKRNKNLLKVEKEIVEITHADSDINNSTKEYMFEGVPRMQNRMYMNKREKELLRSHLINKRGEIFNHLEETYKNKVEQARAIRYNNLSKEEKKAASFMQELLSGPVVEEFGLANKDLFKLRTCLVELGPSPSYKTMLTIPKSWFIENNLQHLIDEMHNRGLHFTWETEFQADWEDMCYSGIIDAGIENLKNKFSLNNPMHDKKSRNLIKFMKTPIDSLPLSVRLGNILSRYGVQSILDLLVMSEEELKQKPGRGAIKISSKSLEELISTLNSMGLNLRPDNVSKGECLSQIIEGVQYKEYS